MTLREFGNSIVTFWNDYWTQVTTQNILDWSISNLFLTVFFGFFGLILAGVVFGIVSVFFERIAASWEKKGLSYLWVRLDKRFGVFVSGLIMVAGTFAFLVFIGFLAAIVDYAMQ